jgi:hypothetical protein
MSTGGDRGDMRLPAVTCFICSRLQPTVKIKLENDDEKIVFSSFDQNASNMYEICVFNQASFALNIYFKIIFGTLKLVKCCLNTVKS